MQNFRSKAATDIELRFFMHEEEAEAEADEEDEEFVKSCFTCIPYLV